MRMGVHAARRLPGFDYVGPHAYSITCCTFSRRSWFTAAATVEAVRLELIQSSAEDCFAVLAYCFMPDHVHLLLEGTSPTSDLPRLMARWKQKTGYAHRCATGIALWQAGFFDHVLREEEDRDALVRYILANPIRAGLVLDVREYPFWGSGVCSRDELIETLFNRPDSDRGASDSVRGG
jgi:REP-associated tyrosine transposase